MPSSKTIKVRLTIECDFTRQEVYDAIRSRFDDNAPPSEKEMNAIWERLSDRSLGYTDVSDAVFNEDEQDICDKMKDGLADVINDEGLLETPYQCGSCKKFFPGEPMRVDAYCFCEPCHAEHKKEVDETDGWEEVYNTGNKTKGNPLGVTVRENPRLSGEYGVFYQTYGNGGGPGGWGGYWAMRVSSGQHMPGVYEVAGEEFKLLDGVALEFRPEDSFRGVPAAVRLLPLTQERIADSLRKQVLYQEEKQRILHEMAVVKREARKTAV
jgi:hypothetical protein